MQHLRSTTHCQSDHLFLRLQDTLSYHYGKHHRTYVDNLNKQIGGTELEAKKIEDIIQHTWNGGKQTPEFNNAAQTWSAPL